MTRRAEMLPSGSGPFLMVAGAGVMSGGVKEKIHTESGSLVLVLLRLRPCTQS